MAPRITVLATASSVAELIAAGGAAADVVLLDLDLGVQSSDVEADPTTNVQTLRAAGPQVLILTAEHRPIPIGRAIAAGAVGLILKSDPEEQLIKAIRSARKGELAVSSRLAHALITDPDLAGHLAPRERQVFQLVARGVGRNGIGRMLNPRQPTLPSTPTSNAPPKSTASSAGDSRRPVCGGAVTTASVATGAGRWPWGCFSIGVGSLTPRPGYGVPYARIVAIRRRCSDVYASAR